MSRPSFRRRVSVLLGSAALVTSGLTIIPAAPAAALGSGSGSISLGAIGAAYTQNFDTLATAGTTNALAITGWYLDETGTSGNNNGQYAAGTGSGNGGDTYSFGASGSAERALGTLFSGTLRPTIGAQFVNDTGQTITSLDVSYTGEMWRAGVLNRGVADRLDFQISTDATSVTNGTWADYDPLDLPSANLAAAVGALSGNDPGNQVAIAGQAGGLSIAAGATFWVRWNEFDISPGADDGLGVDNLSITPSNGDAAPTVTGTFPLSGANDFPITANLSVTFSEPVNVTSNWFTLGCSVSGMVAATTAGGPTTFTIDPAVPLVGGESCTLTVLAAGVTDQDASDPPDNMEFNFMVGFTPLDVCAAPYTPIHQIQGSGLSAAITGTVTTKGVVVGDFEGTAANSGFFIQDLNGDGDPATSDGIFVYTGANNFVSAGQVVRVSGFARERFNQTTLNGSNLNTAIVPAANIVQCGTGGVSPVDVTLPVTSLDAFERYEGMSVRFPQPLVIAEYFNYDRFGEIVLAQPLPGEVRPYSGTAIDEPGTAANARTAANALSRITLDDVQSAQNPSTLRHPNGQPFSLTNRFRGGDLVANAVGVLGFDFSLYRIFPTGPADYTAVNPRPASPDEVGGTVRVAAMNTLNFFVTPDYPSSNPLDNTCGPLNNLECRGWDSDQATEFSRQRDKLLTALTGLDSDIIGLNEIENSAGVEPLVSITSGMPGYDYIATGTIGGDAIKVGLIYRSAVVTPVGDFKLLDSTVDPRFLDGKSRPALAQTFEVDATGARFTVVVNHLKSKGSACTDVGDPDLGDGQGNCSQTRRLAAEALVDWLATDPTGSGDPDFIIVGDLNSYAMEDTIDAIKEGADDIVGTSDDYTNLIAHFQGAFAYSYTFDGQAGYLDHALANASLLDQIEGATEWHINSDEPDVFDYDTSFKPPAQDALYEVNQYRTSDHDPVVVGLTPNAPPTVTASFSGAAIECGAGNGTLSIEFTDPDAADTHELVIDWGDGTSQTVDPATSPVMVPHTYDAAGLYTASVTVTDDHGYSDSVTVPVTVEFTTSGILQPIDSFGTSVFKYGSTIPVKVVFTDCDGSIPTDLAPTISVAMVSSNPPGWSVNEPISTSAADTAGVMRFSDGQWIYNLATRPLPDPSGTYRITITVPETGQTVTANFGLRP